VVLGLDAGRTDLLARRLRRLGYPVVTESSRPPVAVEHILSAGVIVVGDGREAGSTPSWPEMPVARILRVSQEQGRDRQTLSDVAAEVRRRLNPPPATAARDGDSKLFISYGLVIDFERAEVFANGTLIHLKSQEFKLLAFLVTHPDRDFTASELMSNLWPLERRQNDPLTVKVHIHWLRQKIEKDPHRPRRLIRAGRTNYRFVRSCPSSPDVEGGDRNPEKDVEMNIKPQRRTFTAEYKADVVTFYWTTAKSIREIARDLDLTASAVQRWVTQADADRRQRGGLMTSRTRRTTPGKK